MWNWLISDFEGGRLLADALTLRVPAAPGAFVRQFIRKARIRHGDQPLTADCRVASGMLLSVRSSTRLAELAGLGGIIPEELLFEDQHTLVVYKSAGLAVHRAVGHEDDNLVARVARFVTLRHSPYRAAAVHRLDIGTSGPVLFGKGRWATGQYGRLLMAGQISKRYLAVVAGRVPELGELTTPIPDGNLLKPALTRYRCLSVSGRFCLLELDLITGRPHQARRQLADAGWPIVGDRRYGGPAWPGLDHPFLHSHWLRFPDLETAECHEVTCPLPAPLTGILAGAGLTLPQPLLRCEENTAAATKDSL
jgi:23S rRNA-/tRNA-specific pseudouridylate synthase